MQEQTELVVMGLQGSVEDTLRSLDILQRVPENRVVATLDEAREVAIDLLRRAAGPPLRDRSS